MAYCNSGMVLLCLSNNLSDRTRRMCSSVDPSWFEFALTSGCEETFLWALTAETYRSPLVLHFRYDVKHWSWASAERQTLLSVLKRDDRVHFVDVIRAVPENSSEVVCVWRVVQLNLLAESSVLGERVNLSFVINNLSGTEGNGNISCHHVIRKE